MTKDESVVITTFIQKESHIKDMEVSLDTGIVDGNKEGGD